MEIKNMMYHLSVLVGSILNGYFNETRCILYVSERWNAISFGGLPVMLFESNGFGKVCLDYKESERCQDFLITSSNPGQILCSIEKHIQRKSRAEYHSRRYLVIVADKYLQTFFNATCLLYVKDILVVAIATPNETVFNLYTHRYVGEKGENLPVLLDTWFSGNSSFMYYANLFPDKMSNQGGGILRAIACEYLPYSHIENLMGSEMTFVVEFSKKYNYTLRMDESDSWGEIYENWTGYGVLGSVVMDTYDVGFSALFAMPWRVQFSDFSKYTTFSRVTCIVPAPKEEKGWFTHIKVFNAWLWSLIIGAYLSSGLVAHLTKILNKSFGLRAKYFTLLSVIGMFVSHPIPQYQVPNTFQLRYIFSMVVCLTVIVATMYNSRLSSILIVPSYVGEIQTIQDLADSDINWGELQIDWAIPFEMDDRERFKIIYDKFEVRTEEELRELSLTKHFAFGIERLVSGYFAVGGYFEEDISDKYVVMKEDLYKVYTGFQVRKNSVILPYMDKLLGVATQTGLMIYWEAQANLLYTVGKIQKSLKYPKKDKVLKSLTLKHVKGVFLILFIGLAISTLRFSYELSFREARSYYKLTVAKRKVTTTKIVMTRIDDTSTNKHS